MVATLSRRVLPLALAALPCAFLLAACDGSPAPGSRADGGAAAAPTSRELLAEVDRKAAELKDRPKSLDVQLALGNLYFENNRFLDAIDAFRLALQKSAPVEAEVEALRKRGTKAAADLPLECRRSGPEYGLEQIAQAATKLAATDAGKALRCDQEVLAAAVDARSKRGNALYLVGHPDGALAEHKRVLELSPDYPESLFFVGAITLEQSRGDKAQLEEGKKSWRRLLVVDPNGPRAKLVRDSLPKADELFTPKPEAGPMAGGEAGPGALPAGHPPIDGAPRGAAGGGPESPMAHSGVDSAQLPGAGGPSPEMMNAMAEAAQQTERTPELEKGLDELLTQAEGDLDAGRYAEARGKLVRVMPMRPSDPRTSADLGGAMRGLGKGEMAERVLGRALQLDPKSPRANWEMGQLLAARGDKAGARERYETVKAADPKFAQAHGVDGELGKLK